MLGVAPAGGSGVHHDQFSAGLLGQHVDGRSAVKKVEHHLTGDFLGVKADPLGGHAVVSCAGEDHGGIGLGRLAALDDEQAKSEFLQASQAALGFGEVVQVGLALDLEGGVHGGDAGDEGGELVEHYGISFGVWLPKKSPRPLGIQESRDRRYHGSNPRNSSGRPSSGLRVILRPPFPSMWTVVMRTTSPLTAAGPPRICTVFRNGRKWQAGR